MRMSTHMSARGPTPRADDDDDDCGASNDAGAGGVLVVRGGGGSGAAAGRCWRKAAQPSWVYAQRTGFRLNGLGLCSADWVYAQRTGLMLNGLAERPTSPG